MLRFDRHFRELCTLASHVHSVAWDPTNKQTNRQTEQIQHVLALGSHLGSVQSIVDCACRLFSSPVNS